MSAVALDPRWLAALAADGDQPPLRPRLPLRMGPHIIGSVEADYLEKIGQPASSTLHGLLQKDAAEQGPQWRVSGNGTAALGALADALLAARVGRVAHHWRGEQLAVCNEFDQQVATVERGVVRPLGIATRAVHLVGRTVDGRFWVQQRAASKATHPLCWDTLMGGMVSATDTVDTALVRETWEEAGIRVAEVTAMRRGGKLTMRKPSGDAADGGYVVEQVDWFDCVLPDVLVPENQDGEVEKFELLDKRTLVSRLEQNEFTTEAALVLVAALSLP